MPQEDRETQIICQKYIPSFRLGSFIWSAAVSDMMFACKATFCRWNAEKSNDRVVNRLHLSTPFTIKGTCAMKLKCKNYIIIRKTSDIQIGYNICKIFYNATRNIFLNLTAGHLIPKNFDTVILLFLLQELGTVILQISDFVDQRCMSCAQRCNAWAEELSCVVCIT